MTIKEIKIKDDGLYWYPLELANEVMKPSFKAAKKVKVLAGYFSIDSFSAIIEGIEAFFENDGIIDFVIGVPKQGLDPHNIKLVEALKIAESDDDIVAAYTDEIIYQAGKLENEFRKDKVRAFAYLIKRGSINVKFAIKENGFVHSKVFIFEDDEDGLAVSGAANFSSPAFETDDNNTHVFQSWEKEKEKTFNSLKNRVINHWDNQQSGVSVLDGTFDLANRLLKTVGEKDIDKIIETLGNNSPIEEIYNSLLKSPIWLEYTLSNSALFPHQISAVQDALQQWPIKNLFADEVGLGKTLEVGATLKYLCKHKNIERVLILGPASVTTQWQDEMRDHFGLNFSVYDNEKKAFLDCEEKKDSPNDIHKYDNSFPKLAIMSKERATGNFGNHIFKESSEYPELLILDEAHHARGQLENGSFTQTQLRAMIESVQNKITHILFASATPLRKDVMEYYYLLKLLGIETLLDEDDYSKTLVELGKDSKKIDPLILSKIFKILKKTVDNLITSPFELTEEEEYIFKEIKIGNLTQSSLINFLDYQESIMSLIVKLYPTNLFTSRNYRSTLSKFPTYKFPERILEPSPIKEEQISDELLNFQYGLEEYANSKYLSTEVGFGSISRAALGKAMFKEAFVSSFFAAKQRLIKRRETILGYIEDAENKKIINFNPENIIDSDDEEETGLSIELKLSKTNPDWSLILDKGQSELLEVNALIDQAELIEENSDDINPDPKLLNLLEIIKNHFEKTNKPILVFAKYLSTIDAAVEFIDSQLGDSLEGIGIYKGGGDISVKFKTLPSFQKKTKDQIKNYLNKGMLDIIFCSTAAQEGVNLQAASAMVNIDVPWIPSDLEQRIGRIARLGQKSEKVIIHNLWYPNSYEAKIYKRLLERKDLLELALGQFPEIVADAIKTESLGKDSSDISNVVINNLTEAKLNISYLGISKLWNNTSFKRSPRANSFRKNLLETFVDIGVDSERYTIEPGVNDPEKKSISFLSTDFVEKLKSLDISDDKNTNVYLIYDKENEIPYGFYVAPREIVTEQELDFEYPEEVRTWNDYRTGDLRHVPGRQLLNPYFLPTLLKGLVTEDSIKLKFVNKPFVGIGVNKLHYTNQFVRIYKYFYPEWLIPQDIIRNNNHYSEYRDNSQNNNFSLLSEDYESNRVEVRYIGTINFEK